MTDPAQTFNGWDEIPTDAATVDLGDGCSYTRVVDKDGKWIGINEWHRRPDGKMCGGWVPFNVESEWLAGGPKWEVLCLEPLTLSPSLLCTACNHHGFIRNGRWVPA